MPDQGPRDSVRLTPIAAKIPAFPPQMIAEQSHDAAVGERPNVNFGWPDRERLIPKGGEQSAFAALAQAIGAFAAHTYLRGRLGHAAGARKHVEKAELALGGPSVLAELSGRGELGVLIR